jgi:hypothetical protein
MEETYCSPIDALSSMEFEREKLSLEGTSIRMDELGRAPKVTTLLSRRIDNRDNIPRLVYYFKCFFDLGFLVMVIPFRFKLVQNPRTRCATYRLHTNRAQQVGIIASALISSVY